jgi:nucleoside-diphosphate-sugar epimerase
LGDVAAVRRAVEGCDVVFHAAAKPGVWGNYREYFNTNVVGTENVVVACRDARVTRLVYTSSPSVVHSGGDLEGANETLPYPQHFEAHYPRTKAIAERKVLEANGPELGTVSLRPHLIWGPGDNHIVPMIVEQGRAGRLRRIGSQSKRVDAVYIDNAAHAHVLAADRLEPESPIAGKAYFIAQGEPIPVWDLVNKILAAAGLPPVVRSVPFAVAYAAGASLEAIYTLCRLPGEPPMTRFVARQLSTAHWFDLSAAKRDLGYEPVVSMEEGLRRLRESFTSKPLTLK